MSVNNSLVCYPIDAFGSEHQKKFDPTRQGRKIRMFCASEPGHGSDPAGLKCEAKTEGGYILKGAKIGSNGKEADTCIVFATTDKALKHKAICAFIVDKK